MSSNSPTQDIEPETRFDDDRDRFERDRVRRLTFKLDLERIDAKTLEAIRHSSHQGRSAISQRLVEIDREWPVDRALMTGASFIVGLGVILGATVTRKLHAVSALAGAGLLIYAFFGWVPPVLILRRLGIRTQREINLERTALKALRGDFENLSTEQPNQETRINRALKAAY